jgi:serine/threonine protein kinase/tetratricopeptide (TPR) repeat protein
MSEEAIVTAALQKNDPDQRAAFLAEACGGEHELRRRVEALIRAREQAGAGATIDPNQRPASITRSLAQASHPISEGPGSRVGPYKLLQEVGQGGMGSVFMAAQEHPIRRRVALKIIKPGMDSHQVIARFQAERQALALMDHPNIARVLDAGTTDAGGPYFVMELVKGVPITEYCDQNRLDPRQRLELFVPVCQAIQHAHQKGIIHRDVKPSNILVTLHDGKPVPKVIDFGIAKAIDQRLSERTLFTQFGAIIGTPEYMSPEQAEMGGLDIDTRSDIYSLGVLLYELLTGSTPLRQETLHQAACNAMLQRIKEEEPPKPSTRIQTTGELSSIAAQRHIEPAKLVKLVRGELDWIVMKCLEKDRTRRYETASVLARDLESYLHDEPVEAGPPSASYRLKKYARKHRVGLTMATALAVVLVLASAVSTWQAIRATKAESAALKAEADTRSERDRALKAEGEARTNFARAQEDEKKARQSELEAKAVLGFFQEKVLAAGRPEGQKGGLGKDVKLRDAIDAAEPSITSGFVNKPIVEAAIRDTLGTSYWHLGELPKAIEQEERALALRTASLGSNHPDTLTAIDNLAIIYEASGRLHESIALFEQILARYTASRGANEPDLLIAMSNLANAYQTAGRFSESIALAKESFELQKNRLGADDPETLISMNNLASSYWMAGQLDKALPLAEENLRLRRVSLAPGHPDLIDSINNLGTIYLGVGRVSDAIRMFAEALELHKSRQGPDHPKTLVTMGNLANAFREARRYTEAIPLSEEVLRFKKAKLGPDHPDTLISMNNLAVTYWDAGRPADAIPLYEEAIRRRKTVLGPTHAYTLSTMNSLAQAYLMCSRWTEAETILRKCLALREKKQAPDWWRFHTLSQLGAAIAGQKRYAEAERYLVDGYLGLKEHEASIPASSRRNLSAAAARIVPFYEAWGKPDKAAEWRKRLGANEATATESPDPIKSP